MLYKGSCHCLAIKFQVEAEEDSEIENCNCSICAMSGYLHLIVPKGSFNLLSGESNLVTYKFNSGVARHYFCKNCGIKPFYIPRSNPDGVDVNVNCLDKPPKKMRIVEFDGKNWELNAHKLAHKTKSALFENS
ncbi:MAG: aldehyde-activating protein [Gammaproteobacteria bacterium]|nr:aldehyde-activating protein [Gammaproteobacteria bacterium]